MLLSAFTLCAAFSAYLTIRAEYRGPRSLVYVFKPLTMLCIVGVAWLVPDPISPLYRRLILAGLLFSLAGDVFLMLPRDRFVPGLASFLVAHLFYSAAFLIHADTLSWWRLLPFVFLSAALFGLLRPHLGNLQVPVVVYMGVISVMAWAALNHWQTHTEHRGSVLAFMGAVLFLASDALLALDRFKTPFYKARFYVLTTYFAAQWLIAFSVTRG